MADQKTQTQQQPQKPATPGPAVVSTPKGGRPKRENKGPVGNLQYTCDRACSFIHDGTASYARRAKTAAHAGVSKETVLKGFAAMEASMQDARAAIERAYNAPAARKVERVSRVNLGA